jgi:hypothetical protein
VSLRRSLLAFCCLVAVSCAQRTNEPAEAPGETAGPAEAATAPAAADDAAAPESPSAAPPATFADSIAHSIDAPPTAIEPASAPSVSAVDIAPLPPEPAAVAPAAPATAALEPAPPLRAPVAAASVSAETLDFSSLVMRLRKTKAINLRTKVAVKNESDDLLERFRTYHTQHGHVTLEELRLSYDSLFHKLHALLEDADPPLARDIDRSQGALWELLADPRKFSAAVMAGA